MRSSDYCISYIIKHSKRFTRLCRRNQGRGLVLAVFKDNSGRPPHFCDAHFVSLSSLLESNSAQLINTVKSYHPDTQFVVWILCESPYDTSPVFSKVLVLPVVESSPLEHHEGSYRDPSRKHKDKQILNSRHQPPSSTWESYEPTESRESTNSQAAEEAIAQIDEDTDTECHYNSNRNFPSKHSNTQLTTHTQDKDEEDEGIHSRWRSRVEVLLTGPSPHRPKPPSGPSPRIAQRTPNSTPGHRKAFEKGDLSPQDKANNLPFNTNVPFLHNVPPPYQSPIHVHRQPQNQSGHTFSSPISPERSRSMIPTLYQVSPKQLSSPTSLNVPSNYPVAPSNGAPELTERVRQLETNLAQVVELMLQWKEGEDRVLSDISNRLKTLEIVPPKHRTLIDHSHWESPITADKRPRQFISSTDLVSPRTSPVPTRAWPSPVRENILPAHSINTNTHYQQQHPKPNHVMNPTPTTTLSDIVSRLDQKLSLSSTPFEAIPRASTWHPR